MPLDLTLLSLYRINEQEIASLPGLLGCMPTDSVALNRKNDRLIVYLLLTGNATFTTTEYKQIAKDAANIFYQTAGALTNALRIAADHVNKVLLERNMTTSGRGQYAIGWLTLAALRDTRCTLALSGPMHAYWFGQNEMHHVYESATSGKGLGASQTTNVYYSQTTLSAGDRLLFFGRAPNEWDRILNDPTPSSLNTMRRRLIMLARGDLNAVLVQATDGLGAINLSGQKDNKPQINLDDHIPRPASSSLELQQKHPLRVFLCHAKADKPIVRDLYKRLKTEDWIDPWLDEEKLTLGQHWAVAIENAIDDADIVIIFLSRNSVKKEGFVQRELNYAWDISLEKPRNVIFLIPFRLDNCEVPRHLRSRQWGDYFGEEKEETYQSLLRSLKERYKQKIELDIE